MADAQKSIWFGAAFVVVAALSGATLWKVAQPNDDVNRQLAALKSEVTSKIDATNAALAKVQTAAKTSDIEDKLAALDAKVAQTNATLAELKKGEVLKSVAEKLDALNAGIKSTDAALADVTKSIPKGSLDGKIDGVDGKLAALGGGLKSVSDTLGKELKSVSDTLATIKQEIPAQNAGPQIAAVSTQIKSLNDAVAGLKAASANASAGDTAALTGAVGELKKNIDAATALGAKLGDQLAKLQATEKTAAAPKPADLMVVYVHMPDARQLPQPIATVTPLTVQFARIGSADDKGQGKVIVGKLKEIIKGRKSCTISVVGYADTLGGDDVNLDISKRRAATIAAQLKTAFAGTGVQINQAAWGERRLKDWTPDRTPSLANRRVDVAVDCKG